MPCPQKLAEYEGKKLVSTQKPDVNLGESVAKETKDTYKPLATDFTGTYALKDSSEPCLQKLADFEGKKFVSIQKAGVKLDGTEEENIRSPRSSGAACVAMLLLGVVAARCGSWWWRPASVPVPAGIDRTQVQIGRAWRPDPDVSVDDEAGVLDVLISRDMESQYLYWDYNGQLAEAIKLVEEADANGDGVMDIDEYYDYVMRSVDANGDGIVDIDEYIAVTALAGWEW